MLDHAKSVLNFSAFRPEPDDSSAAWKSRFPKKTTALIHLGRNIVSYGLLAPDGEVTSGESKQGEYKEVLKELGPVIKAATHDGWCVVSIDTRYVISVETNLSRKKGSEDALKKDPRSVLHARYEKGKRYAVTHNPETNSSLLLSLDEENIKKFEAAAKEQQLKIGRMCCGTWVLLRHALSVTNKKKGSEQPFSGLYIVCCHGSVCALLQEKDTWMEVRSRPDLFTDDLQPLADLLAPFAERMSPEAQLVLACDEPVEGMPVKISELFPAQTLNDLTEPGLLAKILLQN
jgi:hypothetical protein